MMLNLEEAIKHCEEVAEKQEIKAKSNLIEIDKIKADGILRLYDADEYESCMKCAKEHRQLAEWLKKLQAYEEAREEIIRKRDSGHMERTCNDGLKHAIYIIDKHLKEVKSDADSN